MSEPWPSRPMTSTVRVIVGCRCSKPWFHCDCGAEVSTATVTFDAERHEDDIADDIRRLMGGGFDGAVVVFTS